MNFSNSDYWKGIILYGLHVIPRYKGDMKNPEGGVRGVIPERQKY